MSNSQEHHGGNPELPPGYRAIPPEDQKKAQVFFDRGKTVAGTGNFEYGIELHLQGLNIDPENIDAHNAMREISLKRKASGGKDLGMFEKMKLSKASKEDFKLNMLNCEKLLAYDPGNMDRMLCIFQNAINAGYYDTALWVGGVLFKANSDNPKSDFSKFIALRNGYRGFNQWRLAVEACHSALRMRPEDMDLQKELKDLSAHETMYKGKYGIAKSFRDSIRDMAGQQNLLEGERDFKSEAFLVRKAKEAKFDWDSSPEDMVLFGKYIDALRNTEAPEHENKAIEELDLMHQKTRQFKWRQKVGEIKMVQLSRMERMLRADAERDPDMKKEYKQFLREKAMTELQEFKLISENYPTDTTARFEIARRMFALGQYQEAIPVFQQVRNDPKYRVRASMLLGQCFLAAGFSEEAVDTLKAALDEYPAKGDDRSKDVYYWYGRALENAADAPGAIKQYSQVAQIDFNYLDVQERIKRLRAAQPPKAT